MGFFVIMRGMNTLHRTCIVTGSASGIGAATVLALAHAGYHTFGLDLQAEAASQVAMQAELEVPGTRHGSAACDVADEEQVVAGSPLPGRFWARWMPWSPVPVWWTPRHSWRFRWSSSGASMR